MHTAQPAAISRLLRLPEVTAKTGLARSTIYHQMSRGEFPEPVRITRNCVAWRESDLDAWIAGLSTTSSKDQLAASDGAE